MVEEFDWCAVSETQSFIAQAREPFGIDGLNDLRASGLETTLVGFILDDELFVFRKLAKAVYLVCAYSGREWPRVLGYNERVGAS